MPKIILKIDHPSDPIYDNENICGYAVADSLPREFRKKLAETGKIVLCCGSEAASTCRDSDSDGVMVEISSAAPVKAQINRIREQLAKGKYLGVIIPARRHEAMLASETEPEFVAFKFPPEEAKNALEVIKWYNELFLIQSAVDLTSGLQDISAAGADFVIINSKDYEDFGC